MKRNSSLKTYREKRDFGRTPEPAGQKKKRKGAPVFVIQKHDARRLHYDFRLEAGGVLKSWAVPKGPSLDPQDKRLAVPTEDHPLEYAVFEGVIPKGEYGAGPVLVWDFGTYENRTLMKGRSVSLKKGIEHGHVQIWLEGKKIRGGFALNRMGQKGKPWLLNKLKDAFANSHCFPVMTQPESVLSGKSLADILGEDFNFDEEHEPEMAKRQSA
jgi:DNA ligase D-like protein (predicted 3'-phosphoesterase)